MIKGIIFHNTNIKHAITYRYNWTLTKHCSARNSLDHAIKYFARKVLICFSESDGWEDMGTQDSTFIISEFMPYSYSGQGISGHMRI